MSKAALSQITDKVLPVLPITKMVAGHPTISHTFWGKIKPTIEYWRRTQRESSGWSFRKTPLKMRGFLNKYYLSII